MLNRLDIKIKLTPSKDAFNLLVPDNITGYRSVITSAALLVRKAKLNPAISLAHEKALLQSNAKYLLKRISLKTCSVALGMLSHAQDNLFLSQTPTRVVIGLVYAASFNGSYKANPINFETFGLAYLSLSVDGRVVTGKPLMMDFDHSQYVRAFFGTNLAMGLISKDAGNEIDYWTFKYGYTLYAFDLTPSLLNGDQFEMARSGPLAIELKFARVLTAPIQVIIYAELDSVLEVSKTDKS